MLVMTVGLIKMPGPQRRVDTGRSFPVSKGEAVPTRELGVQPGLSARHRRIPSRFSLPPSTTVLEHSTR